MSQYRKTLLDEWPPRHLAVHDAFEDDATRAYARYMTELSTEAVAVIGDEAGFIGGGDRSLTEMPGMFPPFRATWIDIRKRDLLGAVGLHWIDHCATLFTVDGARASDLHPDVQSSAQSVLTAFLIWRQSDGTIVGPFVFAYGLDAQGDVLPGNSGALLGAKEGHEHARMMGDVAMCMLIPCAFVVSFMNCKNVTRTEVRPPPALSKRHAERHGRPLSRYPVLDIEPMRKVLRTEGRMDEVGLKRALHLCRGHFKDYREGGGLFGKHKGLYWWDANVRGTVEQGIVAKDYRVVSPGDGTTH